MEIAAGGPTRKVCRRFLLSAAKRSLGRRYNWRSRAPDNSDDNEDKEAASRKKTIGEEEDPEKVLGERGRERSGVEHRAATLPSASAIIARESR